MSLRRALNDVIYNILYLMSCFRYLKTGFYMLLHGFCLQKLACGRAWRADCTSSGLGVR